MISRFTKITIGTAAIAATMVSIPSAVLAGSNRPPTTPPAKTSICHYDKTAGTWSRISVSSQSVAQHMKHGDGLPGGAVPGQTGNIFDASCVPTPL